MELFTCVQNQTSESDGNNKTTLEKGGRNPPDVTLDHIAKDLLSFFYTFERLRKTKNNIEEKYYIKNEDGDYWSADDIKRAWGKTQGIDKKSDKRKHWAHVIILQMLKRLVYDGCKQNQVQEDHDDTTTETKKSCETDDINQACGKAESIKGNSEDGSTHGNDEPKTETATEGVRHLSASKRSQNAQDGTETKIRAEIKGTEKNMDICDECNYICIPLSKFPSESHPDSSYENTNADPNAETNSDYNYKLIDQSPSYTKNCKLYGKKSYVMLYDNDKKNAQWVYEILNKSTVPYHYNKVTFKKDNDIDDDKQALDSINGFKNKDYVRGHLASAANHMWCQEAYKDTYLISNMTPQINSMNNGIWKKLENDCRKIIYQDDQVRNVHVYTGPLYLNNEVSPIKGKEVPTHYFKVVILENVNGKAEVKCHLVENKKIESNATDDKSTDHKEKKGAKKQKQTLMTLKEFEEMSGLTFTHVSDNNKVTVKKTLRCTGEKGRKQATIEVHVST